MYPDSEVGGYSFQSGKALPAKARSANTVTRGKKDTGKMSAVFDGWTINFIDLAGQFQLLSLSGNFSKSRTEDLKMFLSDTLLHN